MSRAISTRAPDPDRKFGTVQELIDAIEEHYWCMQGPPIAFFEIPAWEEGEIQYLARCTYQTLRFGYLGESVEEATPPLLQYLWRAIIAEGPEPDRDWNLHLLFWRLEDKIIIQHFPVLEKGDFGSGHPSMVAIRTRLVIPGHPLAAAATEGTPAWIINASPQKE